MKTLAHRTAKRNTEIAAITTEIAAKDGDMGPITAILARLLACAGSRDTTAATYAQQTLSDLFSPTATAPERWVRDQITAALLTHLAATTSHRQGAPE